MKLFLALASAIFFWGLGSALILVYLNAPYIRL